MNTRSALLFLLLTPALVHAHELTGNTIEAISHQIEHTPLNAELYIKRGWAYADAEEWENAISNFNMALDINPGHPTARYSLGEIHLFNEQYIKAEKTLKIHTRKHPNSVAGHKKLAEVLELNGNIALALHHHEQALRHDKNPSPDSFLGYANTYAYGYETLSDELVLKAESVIKRGITRHGKLNTYIQFLVELNLVAQKPERALFWIEQTSNTAALTPKWMLQKARIYRDMGEAEFAKSAYTELLTQIKDFPDNKRNSESIMEISLAGERELGSL